MPDLGPSELCGYRVTETLSTGRTWLGEGAGRRVVLKLLESDCLLGKELHPLIHDRLGRVRELAHLGVANLYGVQCEGEQAYLVWEYVEGNTWDEYIAQPGEQMVGNAHPAELRREVRGAVESLHTLGIVHGAIHERNVLIRSDGRVMLTHISPLLYSDPQVDLEAMQRLLEKLGPEEPAAQADEEPDGESRESPEERRARKRALLGALLTAVAGVLIAWALWKWAGRATTEQVWNNHVAAYVL